MTTAVFKHIGLIGKSGDSNVSATLRKLVEHLESRQARILLDEDIADILGAMTNYLGYHFDTEEQMMLDYGYPELESHREEHQAFVTQTAYFIATYREGGASLKRDILLFLKEWLVEHIVKTDGAFGDFLKDLRPD